MAHYKAIGNELRLYGRRPPKIAAWSGMDKVGFVLSEPWSEMSEVIAVFSQNGAEFNCILQYDSELGESFCIAPIMLIAGAATVYLTNPERDAITNEMKLRVVNDGFEIRRKNPHTVIPVDDETIANFSVIAAAGYSAGDIQTMLSQQDAVKPPIYVKERRLIIPNIVKELGVAGDRFSEAVTFIVDRYSTEFDLNDGKAWFIELINANPGTPQYDIIGVPLDALTVEEETITFQWIVNPVAVKFGGDIQVRLLCFLGENFIWRTHTGILTVYKTFWPHDAPGTPVPDPGLSYMEDALERIANMLDQIGDIQNMIDGMEVFLPYINPDTGTWMLYDRDSAQYIDSGVNALGIEGPPGLDGAEGAPGPKGEKGNVMFASFELEGRALYIVIPDEYNGPQFSINYDTRQLEVEING